MLWLPWHVRMTRVMDSKDRIIKILALLLLMMTAVAMYQRTNYENELNTLRHTNKRNYEANR